MTHSSKQPSQCVKEVIRKLTLLGWSQAQRAFQGHDVLEQETVITGSTLSFIARSYLVMNS